MIASWYDVLGVDVDATTDEIRAAWQESVAGLDPTDRRFKQRNRAAEVLLDTQRRAAHDAELAEQEVEEPDDEAVDGPADGPVDGPDTATRVSDLSPNEAITLAKASRSTDPDRSDAADVALVQTRRTGTAGVAVTVVLGVAALLLLIATIVAVTAGSGSSDETDRADSSAGSAGSAGSGETPASEVGDSSLLPDAREVAAARKAAETAIGPVLSYDYRTLDESRDAATSFMTDAYAAEYEKNFVVIEDNAPRSQTIVTAEVVASGIVRTGEDRVDVLIFVNRPTRNVTKDVVSRDQVTVRMLDVDGQWLVDCLITEPGGTCGD